MAFLNSPTAVLAFLLLFLIALAFFLWSLYPRRRGTTLHCRRCNYNLSGTDRAASAARCSECGADVASDRAIVVGERSHRPWLVVPAVIVTLTAFAAFLITGFHWARSVDWYRWKPTAWVIDDAVSQATIAVADRTYRELMRRYNEGALTQDHITRLAGAALSDHASTTTPIATRQLAANLLGILLRDGRFLRDHSEHLLDNLSKISASATRQRIATSEKDFIELSATALSPSGVAVRWIGSEHLIDGVPYRGGGEFDWKSLGGVSVFHASIPITHLPAGEHRHSCRVRVQILRSSQLDEFDKALAERTFQLETAFNVPPRK